MKHRPLLSDLASYLAVHTWPTLKGHYSPDCCIAGTRVCMAVLEHFDYESREIQVVTSAINRVLYEMCDAYIKAGKGNPKDDPEHVRELEEKGAFQVIIGHPLAGDDPVKIGTHLIVEAEGATGKYYIDPTITQADRPEKKLFVPYGVAFHENAWQTGGAMFSNGKGTYLLYQRHPRPDPTYKTSPDWKSDRWYHLAGKLIRGARELAA